MHKQALLRFQLPPQTTFFPVQFKDLVSKACDSKPSIPESFFHYEGNMPIPGSEPDIRFVGGKTWVGILSRSGDKDAILPAAGFVAMAMNDQFQRPLKMEMIEPKYDLEITQFPYRYNFRSVVCKKANKWQGSNEDLIAKLVIRTLQKERDRMGLDIPGLAPNGMRPREFLAAEIEFMKERLQVVVHDVSDMGMRLVTAGGPTNTYTRLLSGSFSMYAKAMGYWQIGNLQSRGHGRLTLAREQ